VDRLLVSRIPSEETTGEMISIAVRSGCEASTTMDPRLNRRVSTPAQNRDRFPARVPTAGMSDRFPEPNPGPSADLLALRFGCAFLFAAVVTVVFWDVVEQWVQLLWPPTEPFSRWFGLAVVVAGGYLLGPGILGTLVADWLYRRRED
jgi:hypothetical protein